MSFVRESWSGGGDVVATADFPGMGPAYAENIISELVAHEWDIGECAGSEEWIEDWSISSLDEGIRLTIEVDTVAMEDSGEALEDEVGRSLDGIAGILEGYLEGAATLRIEKTHWDPNVETYEDEDAMYEWREDR